MEQRHVMNARIAMTTSRLSIMLMILALLLMRHVGNATMNHIVVIT